MRRSKSLDQEQRFSELLGILSTRFVSISESEFDREIDGWLGRISNCLGLDRMVLAEYLPDKGGFYTSCRWRREGIPPAPGPMASAADYLPWVSAKGSTGEIVQVPNVAALPRAAAHDRNFMLEYGMKAIFGVPLAVGNRLLAGLTLEDFRAEREWTPALLRQLKLASEIFANALERKRLASDAAKLRDEAENTKRLVLLGEMAASMAHELSHPLSAILANAQAAKRLLQNRQPRLTELSEALDDVIIAERRAAAYVAEVRTIFRRSELHRELLEVRPFIEEVIALMQQDLQAREISLRAEIDPKLLLISADRVGLEQVLINLILNAADAVAECASSVRLVVVSASRKRPRSVSIAVRDNGKGIPHANLSRIFQPLFTTRPSGTGLGLAIVRSIVESHGTKVEVASTPGVGSTFSFALPRAEQA